MAVITSTLAQADSADRVAGFDLLRGICALAVACYHATYWSTGGRLETLGTYPVYIFFVLSGASMYVAYARRFAAGFSAVRFVALRFIRLAPLYILALAVAVAWALFGGAFHLHDLAATALNIPFAFALGNPGATSQVVGGWSLGIEFAFYLLFPVMLAFTTSKGWLWFVAASFAAQHLFIASVFSNGGTFDGNWVAYTQFLAFGFYFAAGCAIGRALMDGRLPASGWPLFVATLAIIAMGAGPNIEASITGWRGIVLSLVAAAAVATSATLRLGPAMTRAVEALGTASYGVYILHPWIYKTLVIVSGRLGVTAPLACAVATPVLSFAIALTLHKQVETPAQRLLKRMLLPRS